MKIWRLLLVLMAVSAALAGCQWLSGEPDLSPQEVVTKFYRWYIGYPGNPLVDRSYRDSPYLAESFVQDVDEVLASFDKAGADPILLAQDIPERFTVEETETSRDEATVTLYMYFGGNDTPAKREVELKLIDGEWKITDVAMRP